MRLEILDSASHSRFAWATIFVVALILRVVAAGWWEERIGDQRFGFPDSESYWVLGQSIAAGERYEYGMGGARIFRTPGYPLLLAGVFATRGDDCPTWLARCINIFIGTISVGVVAWLTKLLFDQTAAFCAAVMTALYPGAIATSVFLLAEAPFILWMLLATGCWLCWIRSPPSKPTIALAASCGVLHAAATLTRPSWLLFLPLLLLLTLWAYRGNRQVLTGTMITLAAFLVVLSPWWIRNFRISGKFVVTTSQTGASLYDGQGPQATGASNMDFVQRFVVRQKELDQLSGSAPAGLFEIRLDRSMRDAARRQMWAAPQRVLRLAAIKIGRTWNFLPNNSEFQSTAVKLQTFIGFVPLALLAAAGMWRYRIRKELWIACLLPAIYFTTVHSIFVGSIRYRQPPMMLLIVPAAAFAAAYLCSRTNQTNKETAK